MWLIDKATFFGLFHLLPGVIVRNLYRKKTKKKKPEKWMRNSLQDRPVTVLCVEFTIISDGWHINEWRNVNVHLLCQLSPGKDWLMTLPSTM